jgi:hypothetical protein
MGHGEEVTLRFPAHVDPPTPLGHRRTFLLKTDSFSKDMDPYTAYPHTVEPLPFHAMSSYPYGTDEQYPDNERTRPYRRLFNTRHVRGSGSVPDTAGQELKGVPPLFKENGLPNSEACK